jgi:hypothetical protein
MGHGLSRTRIASSSRSCTVRQVRTVYPCGRASPTPCVLRLPPADYRTTSQHRYFPAFFSFDLNEGFWDGVSDDIRGRCWADRLNLAVSVREFGRFFDFTLFQQGRMKYFSSVARVVDDGADGALSPPQWLLEAKEAADNLAAAGGGEEGDGAVDSKHSRHACYTRMSRIATGTLR